MAYLTVCTPTYNRAYILRRPFESLLKQTFKDFEWLIIDDGSSDNTENLVKEFIEQADFSIKYVSKPNGGRASALNESYQHIQTEYVINLDSDDELVPDALEKIYHAWENIPENERDRFWCVVGHCVDQKGNRIGGDWPEDINEKKEKRSIRLLPAIRAGRNPAAGK